MDVGIAVGLEPVFGLRWEGGGPSELRGGVHLGEERNQIPEVWIDPGETRQVTDTLPGGTEVHLDLYVDLPGDVMPSTEAVITMNGNMTVVITNASNVVVEYTVTGG